MGSHGGATAEGQRAQLARLGVTPESVGAGIVSSMDVVAVAESAFGVPVWASRDLAEADGVVVVNRVKPHTDFHGEVESGLVKMLVIGAGKQAGAQSAHGLTIRHGFPAVLRDHGERLLAALPVLCGIAVVEDQYERTAVLEVVPPAGFFDREAALLARARELLPRLPFDQLDVLVVDELGKDVSGAGMDTNVIGRLSFWGGGEPPALPRITRIYVRGLTAATHGNACGIGMADFVSARCAAAVDRAATDVNCITSNCPEDARLPIACASDREALAACLQTSGVRDPERGAAGLGPGHGAPGADGGVRGPAGRGAGRRGAAPRRPALPSALRRERRPAVAVGGMPSSPPARSAQVVEGLHPRVVGDVAELLLDAQQLVVLGDAVGAAGGAGLDLAGVGRHGEVGDGRVLGLAGAVATRRPSSRPRLAISMASSVSVSVPIWLTLIRMRVGRRPSAMPRARRSVLVTKRSSPTSWTLSPSSSVMQLASRPSRPRPGRPRC